MNTACKAVAILLFAVSAIGGYLSIVSEPIETTIAIVGVGFAAAFVVAWMGAVLDRLDDLTTE